MPGGSKAATISFVPSGDREKPMMRLSGFLLLGVTIVSSAASAGENWPRFRGPSAVGVAQDDERLPDRWSKTENVSWRADVPGWGWSSPVVWGNRVFLTTVVSKAEYEKPKKGLYRGQGRREPPKGAHRWMVYGFDVASGEVVWTREAHQGEPASPRHPKSTYASETPATDGERLYVLFSDVGLYCYDLNGKPLWAHRVKRRETFFGYGAAASPVVHGDQVIMVYDNQEESYIASFDAKTGAPRWRTKRDEKSTWATPFVWEHTLRTEIVAPGRNRIRSYDLSGKLLWELDGKMSGLVIPSPFASRGLVYITSGYVGDRIRPVYAIKPGAAGDITPKEGETTSAFIEWHQPKAGPYNTSPIVYRGHYYTLLDRGFVTCHDARTGKEVYGKRRLPLGATFTASPWAYNGKIFCLSEVGDTYVVRAGPEFKLLRTNSVDALCMASPAVCQGKLFIRSASGLYCFTQLD